MRSRILLFLATLILVPLLTYFVILFARGYRPIPGESGSFQPTGILAANSLPQGAQLYINGEFKSATDTNINLPPGSYQVEIKKDTYYPWHKTLEIKAEEVTRAVANLFPTVPTLKTITTNGASLPMLSPDGTKVVFVQTTNRASSIYLLDLSDSPLGILNRDPKLVSTLQLMASNLVWSPDSKQILAIASSSAYLVDINSAQPPAVTASPSATLAAWNRTRQARESQKFATLPKAMQEIMASSAANLIWSPKENKVMYTATASATIPDELVRPLPGSSTQVQSRSLKPQTIYIYDLEEDRNFLIATPSADQKLSWFPTSSHLIKVKPEEVTIFEYDGSNSTVVYSGPMEDSFAYPYPSSRQLLILANLNPTLSRIANLFAVSLR